MATLFKQEDGRAIRFYMFPCEERARLSPLIQEHGGIVSSRRPQGSVDIRIAVPGKKVHSEGFVRAQYIYDCIKEGVLLDLEKYKIDPEAVSDVSDIEDDSSSNILRVRGENKVFTGRKAYILSEDKAIIQYLLDNNEVENYRGKKVWTDMEKKKVAQRTWQSMRERFSKQILPSIKQYVMDKKDLQRFLKLVSEEDEDVECEEEDEVVSNSQDSPQKKANEERCASPASSSDYQSAVSSSPEKQPKSLKSPAPTKGTPRAAKGTPRATTPNTPCPASTQGSPHAASTQGTPPAGPSTLKLCLRRCTPNEKAMSTPTRSSPRKRAAVDESESPNTSSSSIMTPSTVVERSPLSAKSSPNKASRKKKNDVMAFLQSQSQSQAFNESTQNGNDSEEMDEEQEQEVAKLLEISKKICDGLNLTQAEFFHALYACNGSVSGAVHWILDGKTSTWNLENDRTLLEGQGESHKTLRETYSDVGMESRLKFLTEYLKEYR